jgi:rsbT co-antagonist protein RsbR
MFIDPTLAGLMSGFQKMVGTRRFFLAMQSEGRRNIHIDWQIIQSQPTFEQGFAAWSNFPILAGWGRWEILSLDRQHKHCHIRIHNSFEGLYQQALGVDWGSGVAAGKCAGIFSLLFETDCWAEQTASMARGDPYDEFVVQPSTQSIEHELDNLLADDTATRADLAVALQQLQEEMQQRTHMTENLRMFQFALDNISDGVHWLDADGRNIYVNTALCRNLGYTREALLEMTLDQIDPDVTQQRWYDELWPLVQEQGSVIFESRHQRKDGHIFPVEITANYVDFQDQPYIMAFVRDISERKQQEDNLRLFKAMADTAPDGFGIADARGIVTYANAAYRAMSGYGDALIGMPFSDHFSAEGKSEALTAMTQASTHGEWRGLLYFQRPDGAEIPVETTGFAIRDAEGTVIAMIGLFRDITEQQQQEAERERLQQQVIDAQRDALRELSTPLIPITDEVVIMPLIGTIDSGRAQQVMEALLEGVAHHQATLAILDITGVSVVDTQVAQALVGAARAVRLLGARVMLTGIQPQIAQTLVTLGVDLNDIQTQGSLQAGIAAALA